MIFPYAHQVANLLSIVVVVVVVVVRTRVVARRSLGELEGVWLKYVKQ